MKCKKKIQIVRIIYHSYLYKIYNSVILLVIPISKNIYQSSDYLFFYVTVGEYSYRLCILIT